MKICPVCGTKYPDEAKFCPKDGSPLTSLMDDNIGKILMGQFRLEEKIGEGAVSEVYRALQLGVDRVVAVKILKRNLANNQDIIKRFRREAKAIAKLSHPNIVSVYVVGEIEEENLPYMVMEYLEGQTLEIILSAQAPLDTEYTISLSKQIAGALEHAHNNGIVHRDLKPSNIIVVDHSTQNAVVKVLDFGIAKIIHGNLDESQITRTGEIFGTPYYLSPEQAKGEPIDGRSDLYSLGVIMFRMATGRLPFGEDKGLDVLIKHMKEQAPDPRDFMPSVPNELAEIINRLLKKDPDERFPSGAALIDALDACCSRAFYTLNPVQSIEEKSNNHQDSFTSKNTVSNFEEEKVYYKNKKNIFYIVGLFLIISIIIGVWFIFMPNDYKEITRDRLKKAEHSAEQVTNKTKDEKQKDFKQKESKEFFACEYEFENNDSIIDDCATIPLEMSVTTVSLRKRIKKFLLCSKEDVLKNLVYHSFPPYKTPGVRELNENSDSKHCVALNLNMPDSKKAGLIIDLPNKNVRLELLFDFKPKPSRHNKKRRTKSGRKRKVKIDNKEKILKPQKLYSPPKLPKQPKPQQLIQKKKEKIMPPMLPELN